MALESAGTAVVEGRGHQEGASSHEAWGTRIGLILAMAGNAVGLGNFLRFPRQAAVNGGGSFMITYFIALLLLGIPLMWIEWGIGRNGGRYRKGHIPGMFAAIWRHPAAKYLGVLGLVIPLTVMIYYTYIESWTLAFTAFSITGDYWGHSTQEGMVGYLQSFQGVGGVATREHAWWTPYAFFLVTLAINIWVLSRGVSKGIERLARIGMPILFLFAAVLAVVVLTLPAGPDGSTAFTGLQFIYNPDFSGLANPSVWLASAGQIFFTLSVGMGSLHAYASYLSRRDDIALNGIATAATNETAEVILGSTIAIPAAVVFFGVSGAMAIAQSGSFNLGFATMPVVFQQLPNGQLLGAMWFALLFFAGITAPHPDHGARGGRWNDHTGDGAVHPAFARADRPHGGRLRLLRAPRVEAERLRRLRRLRGGRCPGREPGFNAARGRNGGGFVTIGAVVFMLVSWTLVLGLAGWAFWRVLSAPHAGDRDADAQPLSDDSTPGEPR